MGTSTGLQAAYSVDPFCMLLVLLNGVVYGSLPSTSQTHPNVENQQLQEHFWGVQSFYF